MVPPSMHANGYPSAPTSPSPLNGHRDYIDSMPASSTPTLDVSFDKLTAPPLWPHRLSASFSAMADQIAAASQALALVPSTAFSGSDVATEVGVLRGRLEGIELAQASMAAEFEAFKAKFSTGRRAEGVEEEDVEDVAQAQVSKIEELEKKLNELSEIVKLDQQRLPARLHNARATVMKASLQTPIASNGKPVPGFPLTRGEFEHITKERYEALLKAYAQPLKGDTAAKRDALRAFAGIPLDGQ